MYEEKRLTIAAIVVVAILVIAGAIVVVPAAQALSDAAIKVDFDNAIKDSSGSTLTQPTYKNIEFVKDKDGKRPTLAATHSSRSQTAHR